MTSVTSSEIASEVSSEVSSEVFQPHTPNQFFIAHNNCGIVNKTTKEFSATRILLNFLLSKNLIGALWSPKHLFCVMDLLFKNEMAEITQDQKASFFTLMCKDALSNYKALTFDEIMKTREELKNLVGKKISAYFRVTEISLDASWAASNVDHTSLESYFVSKWDYMKITHCGTEIQM